MISYTNLVCNRRCFRCAQLTNEWKNVLAQRDGDAQRMRSEHATTLEALRKEIDTKATEVAKLQAELKAAVAKVNIMRFAFILVIPSIQNFAEMKKIFKVLKSLVRFVVSNRYIILQK